MLHNTIKYIIVKHITYYILLQHDYIALRDIYTECIRCYIED